jgi:Protein of unknown function (DUF707)
VTKQHLVVVRAGDNSLHPHWLASDGDRTWDLVVSYFGDDPDIFKVDDVVRIDSKGPKWPALYELFSLYPNLTTDYDYIWLPDDDLMASKADINRLFDVCVAYGLEVGHPGLTWNSYCAHLITLRNDDTRLRYTNYVELMAPCLSAALLDRTRCYFNKTLSGWGLELAFAKFASNTRTTVAFIDEVTVRHTRPVGGPNYKYLRDKNISPWDEMRAFCRFLDIDERPIVETYSAVLANGRRIDRGRRDRLFDFRMLAGWLAALKETPHPRALARRMAGYTYKALRQIPDRVIEYG